jgi:hypothetical protein
VAYSYGGADQISQIMYPSGRVVTYTRGDTGHITDVTTAASIGGSAVNVATSIVRFPHAGIIKSFDYGNALSQLNTVDVAMSVTLSELQALKFKCQITTSVR